MPITLDTNLKVADFLGIDVTEVAASRTNNNTLTKTADSLGKSREEAFYILDLQANVPATMVAPVATAGAASASVAITPPATGGSPITKYTVTSSPGGVTKTGTASPIVVTGLTPAQAYTFTVKATNDIGDSVASPASNSVTAT